MKLNSLRSLKRLLLSSLLIGMATPALALGAAPSPTQSFFIYGQAQISNGPIRLMTPVIGRMDVDPNFTDRSFGTVGRVILVEVRFPFLPRVPVFNKILAQGPEISGITPLKYDVVLLNAKGEQVQFQFTTARSPVAYPGFGTPVGSLVNFSGGSFMQGSNSGPIEIGYGHGPIFLQNFRGEIASRQRGWYGG